MHITIVDDSVDNLNVYKAMLGDIFQTELINKPDNLFNFLQNSSTDLILLDIHMPEMSGFDVFKLLEQKYSQIPVIFITGDSSESTQVEGWNLGADDFIAKPVSSNTLIARIKNKISKNKQPAAESKIISIGPMKLDPEMQVVELDGKKVDLTPIEFKFVFLLAKNPNKILNRDYINGLLWPDTFVQKQNIDTHLSNLRKKLYPFSDSIKTIKSRGYILEASL